MNNKYINDKSVSETDAESGIVGLKALLIKENNKNQILYKTQPFHQDSQERTWEHTRDVWSRCQEKADARGPVPPAQASGRQLSGQTQKDGLSLK